ncbi:MAG: carbohydrate binding family 9 domain-containing protein, partial [Cyclobacteriaceae bacterium]|nr:carbohydrate binding family 9 domain-containing protein [Cyclobacteriaceae bacterium]
QKGALSTRKTVVFSAQFGKNLYFAFKCYVHDKSEINARIQRRDQVDDSDDAIAVLLDTYNDKRTSLLFIVNPLSTLSDAKVTDDGKNMDFNWDMEWEAKAIQTPYGWSVEMVLPFSSMQFAPKAKVWGINFSRVIRANQETTWWSEVTENFRISQGGILQGVNPKGRKKSGLSLFPYGTLRYEDSDITGEHNKVKADAGVDLRYNIGSNLIANLTYNPDFATVEGDKEQINLTPWELRFPDKRLFFQDGNEMFSTRINTFYSRRIGDMRYGGKFIGKAGKYQFNGLFAKTKEIRDENNPEPGAWHNALRIRRDILNSSSIGLTYADKIWDGEYVRSLSLDYILNLGKTWKFTGQLVGSAPGDFASHSAWFVRFARENNIYHYHIRYSSFGKNFQDNVNETGFIRDDDRHEIDIDINYKWWIDKGLKYIGVSGKNNMFWSQSGVLRSWYFTYGGRAYTKSKF